MDRIPKLKTKEVEKIIAEVTGVYEFTSKLVSIDDLLENPWNPNVMPDDLFQKLKGFMQELWVNSGYKYLPTAVTVRPHVTWTEEKPKYQIIDGKHRRLAFMQLREEGNKGFDRIPCIVGNWDTKTSMLLTDALNYIHGEPEIAKRLSVMNTLHTEYKMPIEELSLYVPETRAELETNLRYFDYGITKVEIEEDEEAKEKRRNIKNDDWIEFKAIVSKEQWQIIEQELARIIKEGELKGKNLRGRALEFMAVQSSQTPTKGE